jgi:sulfur transfer complex TusBCD TusB component (DsrH family)
MDHDLVDLIEKRNIPVFIIEEDLVVRGISRDELVPGVQLLSAKMLSRQMVEYEIVSHW